MTFQNLHIFTFPFDFGCGQQVITFLLLHDWSKENYTCAVPNYMFFPQILVPTTMNFLADFFARCNCLKDDLLVKYTKPT